MTAGPDSSRFYNVSADILNFLPDVVLVVTHVSFSLFFFFTRPLLFALADGRQDALVSFFGSVRFLFCNPLVFAIVYS